MALLLAFVYAAPVFRAVETVNRSMDLSTAQEAKLEALGYDEYSYDDDTQPDYWIRYLTSTNGLPMPRSPKIKTYTEEDTLWNETFLLNNGTWGYNIISDLDNEATRLYGIENVSYSSIEVIGTERIDFTEEVMMEKMDNWETSVVGNYADASISRDDASVSNISRTGEVVVNRDR